MKKQNSLKESNSISLQIQFHTYNFRDKCIKQYGSRKDITY